ncbi:adenylate/guanylate cyclase domain-containing protein [Ramlibacter rhizophilus]|uniref:adenylate/guanylate cyclase domain-containing protein n=1 Tax=Ramlibacter rhizophilus TaxID=1781167 RepID=UPI001F0F4260|nr:adenylate/guanylate cyclase domain-containing protein [Ramlibacter rhizophilus]
MTSSLLTRRLRLATGLILFLFVTTHLLNHALGLVSLQAAEHARLLFLALWRNGPATIAFYGALLVHVGLALMALHERHTFRMPWLEAVRIVVGLCIPVLLAVHFTGSRLAHELYGVDDRYARVVPAIWDTGGTMRQLALLVLAWLHGCLGIHFVLRHRRCYREWFYVSFAAMVLLPLLAALGFVNMAREIDAIEAAGAIAAPPSGADAEHLGFLSNWIVAAFLGLVSIALLLRAGRLQRERRLGRLVRLAYPQRTVDVPLGWSVLEASRAHGIPHLSLCGGRARCSTCRVRVSGDPAALPLPTEAELRTLRRVRAASDVRLACQLRPIADIGISPVLQARDREVPTLGSEREVVVLFIDLRRWTTLSERHLPHDLAYVLDQFFEVVGTAVRSAGGVPNQFIGDSVMALFGLEQDVPTACRQAIAATQAIESEIQRHRDRMRHEFGATLDFGIGLHMGLAAVGEVGWRETRTFTAVGDTVNTAARLQELCKVFAVRLVASELVIRTAGLQLDPSLARAVDIRGRAEPLGVYAIGSPGELPACTPRRE